MRRISILLTLAFFVSACGTHYQVSTNLDKENFQQYFSASEVKIFESEQAMPSQRQFIGLVEGQDCQVKSHHAQPDKIIARTQARQQAYEKKANAVVFIGCAELSSKQLAQLSQSNDAKQCHAITICYGKAFAVKTNNIAK